MAEASCNDASSEPEAKEVNEKGDNIECAVCLQTCVHPAQLPCGHIFCFLCVKGIANQSKKCAMCRQEIPRDFIEQPHLLERPPLPETCEGFDGGFQWFYEGRNGWWRYDPRTNEEIEQAFKLNLSQIQILICGELYVIDLTNSWQYCKKTPTRKRNIRRDKINNLVVKGEAGWWQYDERTSKELESSYKKGERICEFLIAGFLYIVDLENMIQLRRNDPSRRRKIKRDYATIPKKGIAGLRSEESLIENLSEVNRNTEMRNEDSVVPVTPSNTPQSPTSGRESPREEHDLQATMERISSLQLSDVINNEIEDNSGHQSYPD